MVSTETVSYSKIINGTPEPLSFQERLDHMLSPINKTILSVRQQVTELYHVVYIDGFPVALTEAEHLEYLATNINAHIHQSVPPVPVLIDTVVNPEVPARKRLPKHLVRSFPSLPI